MKLSENLHCVYVIIFENVGRLRNKPYVKQDVVSNNKIFVCKAEKIGENTSRVGAITHHFIGYPRYAGNKRWDGKPGVAKTLKGVNNLVFSDFNCRKFNYKVAFRVKTCCFKVNNRVIFRESNNTAP